MSRELKIVGLNVYGVKGLRGESCDQFRLSTFGAPGDREFMIIEADSGKMITQRGDPRLTLITVVIAMDAVDLQPTRLDVCLPGGIAFILTQEEIQRIGEGQVREVKVHLDPVFGKDCGEEPARVLSEFLGRPVRLLKRCRPSGLRRSDSPHAEIRQNLAFQDGQPLLLCTEASLAAVNRGFAQHRPDVVGEKGMINFRPNIVVEGDLPPGDELFWREVGVNHPGADAVSDRKPTWLWGLKRCDRCVVPDVDPATGSWNGKGATKEVLTRMGWVLPLYPGVESTRTDQCFGMQFAWKPGLGALLAVGDVITVTERWPGELPGAT